MNDQTTSPAVEEIGLALLEGVVTLLRNGMTILEEDLYLDSEAADFNVDDIDVPAPSYVGND